MPRIQIADDDALRLRELLHTLTQAGFNVSPVTDPADNGDCLEERHREEIAQRQQAERALRESMQRHRSLVVAAAQIIWTADAAGQVIDDLPSWRAYTGQSREAILGGGWLDAVHPDDREHTAQIWSEAVARRTRYEVEYRIRRPDGTYRLFAVRGVPLSDDADWTVHYWDDPALSAPGAALLPPTCRIREWVGVCTDITERKQTENALIHERDLLHALMNNVPDAIYFKDTESRFIHINRSVTARFGLAKPEDGIGKTDFDFFTDEHAHKAFEDEREVMRTGQPIVAREEKEVWPDGRVTWVSSTKMPLQDHDGLIVGTFGISRDITRKKEAEAELRKAKEAAEAANRAKSEFLANMSHEIRTPMNAIIGMTELLADTELTPEQRDYQEMVRKSADALLALINDILDFSKIEAGKLDLDPTEFSLRDTLGDTLGTLSLRAYQKGLELACHIAPDVPDNLVGDTGRLRQILVNLVGNALKFTERGEVLVRVRNVESSANAAVSKAGRFLQFDVCDTGIGIPADKLETIFEAFTQADSSTTRRYGGTGLGLTISTRLATLMGGRIWVDSEVGKGSTFHFTACFGEHQHPTQQHGPEERARIHGLRALIVDDNDTNRRILEEILAHWELISESVNSGSAALALLDQARATRQSFDLILLDVQMPEMDGFTLAGAILARPECAGVKVLMLTSGGQPGDAALCRTLGVAAYLTKPVKQADLWRALMRVLGIENAAAATEPSSVRPAQMRPMRILLAEDNVMNQRLATRLLEKQGHSVVVVNNGNEALATLEDGSSPPFDLVLMDIQMPSMDGLEAAAAIRVREKETGAHLPIIAMTAYAMKGDRDRCLAAGMDFYLAKPIRPDELYAAIAGLTGSITATPTVSESKAIPSIIDWKAARVHVGEDEDLLRELIIVFLSECPRWRNELRAGLQAGDAKRVNAAAHPLKGSLATLGADEAYALAFRLESAARSGTLLAEGRDLLDRLERELERVLPALGSYVDKGK